MNTDNANSRLGEMLLLDAIVYTVHVTGLGSQVKTNGFGPSERVHLGDIH